MKSYNALVGLTGVADTPASGLFVNDLPGISSEFVTHLADAEKADAAGVWESVVKRAKHQLQNDTLAALEQEVHVRRVLLQCDTFKPLVPFAPATDAENVRVYVPQSAKRSVRIDAILLYAQEPATGVTLTVLDALDSMPATLVDATGTPKNITPFDVVAGYNEIPVHLYAAGRYTDTELLFNILGAVLIRGEQHATTEAGGVELSGYAETYGVNYVSQPFGLRVTVECSIPAVLEREAMRFAAAFQLLLAVELLKEKLHTHRTNFFASGNLQLTEINLEALQSEYRRTVRHAARAITLDSVCGTCEGMGAFSYAMDTMP